MSAPINGLQVAIESNNLGTFDEYINTLPIDRIREEMLELILRHNTPSDLKDFTLAAMKGLCAMQNKSDEVFSSEDEAWTFLGKTAVKIAKATLSELQKQQ